MPGYVEAATDLLWEIKWWVDGADWRSWLVHALIGLPIGLVFGVPGVAAAFLIRELEQLAFELMADPKAKIPWVDHVMDVVAPVLLAVIVY